MERFEYRYNREDDNMFEFGNDDKEQVIDLTEASSLKRSLPASEFSVHQFRQNSARPISTASKAPPPAFPRAQLPLAQHRLPDGRLRISVLPEKYRNLFPYESFNKVQSSCCDCMINYDVSCVVSSPTASGKTVVFELAIVQLLQQREGSQVGTSMQRSKVVYVAPIKALVHERASDWSQRFCRLRLRCVELTGDSDERQKHELAEADIILTTPEKWDSLTRKWKELRASISLIALVLIDEVHLLNEDRGPTLEAVVSRMKTLSTDPSMSGKPIEKVRFVALSATIPNISDLGEWLGAPPEAQFTFGDDTRPVPISIHVLGYSPSKNDYLFDNHLNYKLPEVLEQYSDGRPSIVFCTSRKSAVTCAERLKEQHFSLPHDKLVDIVQNYLPKVTNPSLRDCLMRGVAYHHAGLSQMERRVVEELFLQEYISVLCSTSTLAQGVNLPAHLVVIKSTFFWSKEGFKQYDLPALHQMIGRAGRPQFDDSANAVIMTEAANKQKLETLLSGQQTVESKLHTSLIEHLNAEISLGTITDVSVALEWLRSTYLFVRIKKNPTFYKLPRGASAAAVEKRLRELCVQDLERLRATELIQMDDTLTVRPTPLGVAMAKYYVLFGTMESFRTVSASASIEELIGMLATAAEFAFSILRRGEKKTLAEMNQANKYPIKGKIQSPTDKVNCLVQASLQGTSIQDFSLKQEATKLMMDLPRIARCLAEYCAFKEYGPALINAQMLAKMFQQSAWSSAPHIFRQLRGVGPVLAEKLHQKFKTLARVRGANKFEIESAVGAKTATTITEDLKSIPEFQLRVQVVTGPPGGPSTLDVVIVKQLDHEHPHKETQRWTDGINLIITRGESLISQKRFRNAPGEMIQVRIEVPSLPARETENKVRVTLICDDWLGADQFLYVTIGDDSTTGETDPQAHPADRPSSPLPKPSPAPQPAKGSLASPLRRQCKHRCEPNTCRHICCMLEDQTEAAVRSQLIDDDEFPNFDLLDYEDDDFEQAPSRNAHAAAKRPLPEPIGANKASAPKRARPTPTPQPPARAKRPAGDHPLAAPQPAPKKQSPASPKAPSNAPVAFARSLAPARSNAAIVTKPPLVLPKPAVNKTAGVIPTAPTGVSHVAPTAATQKPSAAQELPFLDLPEGWDLDALYGPLIEQ